MKTTILTLAIMIMAASLSYGDIRVPDPKPTPKPKPQKTIDTTLEIRLVADAKEAQLLIPRSQVKELRAQLEQLDTGSDTTAVVTSTGLTRAQTIMSGLFMSLAIVFGGIWFARTGRIASKGVKAAVITIAITAVATTATFVYANAGPPPEARSITGKMFAQGVHWYNTGSGAIKLGVTDENHPQLIVPNPNDKPSGEE